MLTALIIEDELPNRQVLGALIDRYCPDIKVVGEAEGVAAALEALASEKPDLIFLDIELSDGSAFDLLTQIDRIDFGIVFTTAYDQYAIQAIKFNALDYLLKPIDPDELKTAVAKAGSNQDTAQNLRHFIANWKRPHNDNPVITLSTSDSFEYIPVRDVIRCEAQGAYTRFYIRDKAPLLVSKTLKEYEPLLTPFQFFRAHQSHLVNLHEVLRYIKTDGGYVVLKDGTRIGVARTRRDNFLEVMKSLHST